MNEKQFNSIASACDHLLMHPKAFFEWVATPYLHVNNQHPAILGRYEEVAAYLSKKCSNQAHEPIEKARNLIIEVSKGIVRAARGRINTGLRQIAPLTRAKPFDVLIVSWLVHVDHLQMEGDFYFGDLQARLAERGLSSLLVLRNTTSLPTQSLIQPARRTGACQRLMLPDSFGFLRELKFVYLCARARNQMVQVAHKNTQDVVQLIAQKAVNQIYSSDVFANLRLEAQIRALCQPHQPKVAITLYEGHAWERCVWRAAKHSCESVLNVAYQHSVLWQYSHAVKRSMKPDLKCDPDLILTLGDVTKDILEQCPGLGNTKLKTYGTHRRGDQLLSHTPSHSDVVLVLPDGTEVEAVYLVQFALACARNMKDVRFVFRTHPILPFDVILQKLGCTEMLPNVEVSKNEKIDDDFEQAGYLLYRGSSTVLYAILAGLKPFYVIRESELNTDPLYSLDCWRERIDSVETFEMRYRSLNASDSSALLSDWQCARDFCDRYVKPVQTEALDEMLELAGLGSCG